MEGDVGWNHRTPRSTQGDAVLLPLVTRRIRPNRVHADLQLLLHCPPFLFRLALPAFRSRSTRVSTILPCAFFFSFFFLKSVPIIQIEVELILICIQIDTVLVFARDEFSYFRVNFYMGIEKKRKIGHVCDNDRV